MKNIDLFKGEKLFGDNFSESEIEAWFNEEEEGYSGLISNENRNYPYHVLNSVFGFKYFSKNKIFKSALGIGSAFGHEFVPISTRIKQITILEPSSNLMSNYIGQIKPIYIKPNINGVIPFPENNFDLILCFGTLHHIPNVSFVLSEMVRVLEPGGYLLIREPISTMGDWRKARPGLTKNERGIPVSFFESKFANLNVRIIKKSFCETIFLYKLFNKIFKREKPIIFYYFDKFISIILSWNIYYHRDKLIKKIAPGSVFYVIQKKS
jgi:SAM-dependent methyltransferase